MSEMRTDVVIIGAGPAGMMLAIELGDRGVSCLLLDDSRTPYPSETDAPSARTLEYLRRRRLANRKAELLAALERYPSVVRGAGEVVAVLDYGYGTRVDWCDGDEARCTRARYVVDCDSACPPMRAAMGEQRFRIGRCFAIGADAPAPCGASQGGVEDAVNLGWKLAAVIHGWGAGALLDTYETERGPVVRRMSSYQRAMADSLPSLPVAPARTACHRQQRDRRYIEFDARWRAHQQRARYIHQLHAEVRYQSSIIALEPEHAMAYPASGTPGAFAPNVALAAGSLCDYFGRDFTLLWLGVKSPASNWHVVADALGIALQILPCALRQAQLLYGADLVLIRPDGHITWRGDITADANAVLRLATLK